jgi:hypothetical protein
MKLSHAIRAATLGAIVLLPLIAEAAGTITGLLAPPSGTKGIAVKFTVQGSSICDSIQMNYGDGVTETLSGVSFPKEINHTYAKIGGMTVTAKNGKNCNGQATAKITVGEFIGLSPGVFTKSDGTNLARLGILLAPGFLPTIKNVFGIITPGGAMLIGGTGFGDGAGEARLVGSFPGGSLKLDVSDWKDGFIGAKVADVSGVLDQDVKLQVTTKTGAKSNQWPLGFKAKRDTIALPPGSIDTFACAPTSDRDICNGKMVNDKADFGELPFVSLPGGGTGSSNTFYGEHHHLAWPHGGHWGTDNFSATLKNGWTFDSMTFAKGGVVSYPKGFTAGVDSAAVSIDWGKFDGGLYEYHSGVYYIVLWIEGPAGVPYK